MTILNHKLITSTLFTIVTACLFFSFLLISATCFANTVYQQEIAPDVVNLKLWQKVDLKEKSIPLKNKLNNGTFVGYSHNIRQYLGFDLSVDSYIYSNTADNSFAWILGVVGELFKLNYHIDQKEQNEYVEVITHYPVNDSIRVTGYVGNKNDGTYEYQDYSVGVAYKLNQSIEISAGYADRELKRIDAEANLFVNINGSF